MKFPISNFQFPISRSGGKSASPRHRRFGNGQLAIENGFSLVEILVVVSMLSFIVLALMSVFSSTQRAFRASVTQADVLEGGRAAMELIASDLRGMTPSYGVSNSLAASPAVNCFVLTNNWSPLVQSLPGSAAQRTNQLNYFFLLGRENTKWTGTGYIVDTAATNALFPLYRYYAEASTTLSPAILYQRFVVEFTSGQFTNMSRLMDGVVHLTLRAYDSSGREINSYYQPYTNAANIDLLPNGNGEQQFFMFSNAVPASVELELGVLENSTLSRAESLPNDLPQPPPNDRRTLFLKEQVGAVHLFRQRVTIPNVDTTAYRP
jgi:type II secretory pathway pseudopilin PulG